MGIDCKLQFKSLDGSVYAYSEEEKQWYKFGPVESPPVDVKVQVQEIKEKAESLKDA